MNKNVAFIRPSRWHPLLNNFMSVGRFSAFRGTRGITVTYQQRAGSRLASRLKSESFRLWLFRLKKHANARSDFPIFHKRAEDRTNFFFAKWVKFPPWLNSKRNCIGFSGHVSTNGAGSKLGESCEIIQPLWRASPVRNWLENTKFVYQNRNQNFGR